MLRYLLSFVALFGFVVGCGSSSSYKGYAPVTQEEAEAFAKQLVETTAQGDTSWVLEVGEDIDAVAAVCSIGKAEVPSALQNPADEQRAAWKAARAQLHQPVADNLQELKFKEVKEQGNTYIAVFDFVFKKSGKNRLNDSENHITLLKKEDTDKAVIADMGIIR